MYIILAPYDNFITTVGESFLKVLSQIRQIENIFTESF